MNKQKLLFEWDERKDYFNRKKHDVAFVDVTSVFKDQDAISNYDPDHSIDEDRWITIGRNNGGLIFVISHTFRQRSNGDEYVRIISARLATRREKVVYYQR